jgi:glutathione synthase
MVQRYVPEIRQGDKRIILVEGEATGAVLQVPPKAKARANLMSEPAGEDRAYCSRPRDLRGDRALCAPEGLVFVGIDVIGHWLTEINVTSPTGIQEIARLDGIEIAPKIWDAIERARRARQPHSGLAQTCKGTPPCQMRAMSSANRSSSAAPNR